MDNSEIIEFKNLVLNTSHGETDREGSSPLYKRAMKFKTLSKLNKEKENETDIVAAQIQFINEFNTIHLSKLFSYISNANLSLEIISQSFLEVVKKERDFINYKIRFEILRFLFSQESIRKSISSNVVFNDIELKNKLPWGYAELLLKKSWKEGLEFLKTLVKENYDFNKLYNILLEWINDYTYSSVKMAEGFREIYCLIKNDDDKRIIDNQIDKYKIEIEAEFKNSELMSKEETKKFIASFENNN